MVTTLREFIESQWKLIEISQADFARRLGKHRARVEQLSSGDRSFPPEDIAKWSEALELSAEDRAEFERLVYLSRAEKYVVEALESMEKIAEDQAKRIEKQSEKIQELISSQRELLARIQQLEKQGFHR